MAIIFDFHYITLHMTYLYRHSLGGACVLRMVHVMDDMQYTTATWRMLMTGTLTRPEMAEAEAKSMRPALTIVLP